MKRLFKLALAREHLNPLYKNSRRPAEGRRPFLKEN